MKKKTIVSLLVLLLLTIAFEFILSSCTGDNPIIGSWRCIEDTSSFGIKKIVFKTKNTGELVDGSGAYKFQYIITSESIKLTINYGNDDVRTMTGKYYYSESDLKIVWIGEDHWSFIKMKWFEKDDKENDKPVGTPVNTPDNANNTAPNNADIIGTWFGYGHVQGFYSPSEDLQLTLLSNGSGSLSVSGTPMKVSYTCTDGMIEMTLSFESLTYAYIGTCSTTKEDDHRSLFFNWEDGSTWYFTKRTTS